MGNCANWSSKALVGVLAGALSFGLLVIPPTSIAFEASTVQSPSSSSYCLEEEPEDRAESESDSVVGNEGIVEEAWEIVNESFLNTARHRWSPEDWQRKREDIRSISIQTRSKAHDIIKRMLASLGDPYTRFLSPDEFSKMARYDMSGIGINLREVPDENGVVKLKVLGILLDGPAHSAGVRQVALKCNRPIFSQYCHMYFLICPFFSGDEVIAVNGVDVTGKSAFEVSSLLQGPNETFVTIKVKHGKCGPIQSIEVARQLVARTPVFYRLEQVDNGKTSVGYMRLKEFNALARKDLVIAMKRLQDMGASFFVLDLRDNRGGLVQSADRALSSGDLHCWKRSRYQQTIVTDTEPLVLAPVIVLVNNNTASASEIVASALHDNCRAVLVGQKTFGKGLIQSVFELQDSSGVVVTVGKYVTPNHKDINGNGIDPDYWNLPAWSDVKQRLSQCNMLQQG
ncbi:hypothetical protein FNV43_RR05940 [Rhamnella rubrinervis]|uniref:C-terminal processing peptidase n=1 Tax=Rhamnella rubrinervis TaxID=2594499 RepID=A0A8K0HCJ3_9ROSA|nr:hypothetical protein FNV43_RR05940 [Rhamnella rubrinervis]